MYLNLIFVVGSADEVKRHTQKIVATSVRSISIPNKVCVINS